MAATVTYRYLGPRTAITLPPENEGGESVVVELLTHELVTLPAGFEYAERGLRTGLFEIPEAAEPNPKRRNKSEEASS